MNLLHSFESKFLSSALLLVLGVVQIHGADQITASTSSVNDADVTESHFKCPTKSGYYASAQRDSHKFWLCVDSVAHEFICPAGTQFNVRENQCTDLIDTTSPSEEEGKDSEGKLHPQQPKHNKESHHHKHHRHGRRMQQTKKDRKMSLILQKLNRRIDELDTRINVLYKYYVNNATTSGSKVKE